MKKEPAAGGRGLRYAVFAAVFAALSAAAMLFIKIPIPGAAAGYVHPGDAIIYIAASCLPLPFACAAGAVGGLLADVLSGAAAWAPWTFVIKALLALLFANKQKNLLCKRNFIAPAIGLVITAAGYFIAEAVMFTPAGALASIPWNAAQGAASAVIYYALAAALDKAGAKALLMRNS